MEHSANFEKVKGYYDRGLWNLARVQKAVEKKWITEEEFLEITEPVLKDVNSTDFATTSE